MKLKHLANKKVARSIYLIMSLVSFFIENERRYESGERDVFERKTEQELLHEFRMTKQEIYNVCDVVQEDMQPMGSRSVDLTLLDNI